MADQLVPTYVINLARSSDRRAHITAQLNTTRTAYQLVDAVDGRELDFTNTELFDPSVVGTSTFRPGAAGCALSHLEVYRRLLDDGRDAALVLEDDVILPTDLCELAEQVATHMRGAEIVLLNFHSQKPCRVAWAGAVDLPADRFLVQVVDERQPGSTGAYMITREACARMAKAALPVRVHPDNWAFFYREGAIDRLRCVVPMPVANSAEHRTTIDYYKPGSLQARIRELVASFRVPLLYQALAVRRQRTFRRWGWVGKTEFVDELPVGKRN